MEDLWRIASELLKVPSPRTLVTTFGNPEHVSKLLKAFLPNDYTSYNAKKSVKTIIENLVGGMIADDGHWYPSKWAKQDAQRLLADDSEYKDLLSQTDSEDGTITDPPDSITTHPPRAQQRKGHPQHKRGRQSKDDAC